MRRKTLILLLLVVAGCFGAGIYGASKTEPPYDIICFAAASIAALFIVYRFGVLPVRFANAFSTVAAENETFEYRLIDGQPHLMGSQDDVDVAISVVTKPASNVYGFKTECVATATIRENVPQGLRIHRKNDVSWYHVMSGKYEVVVESLSESLMIEGQNADHVRAFCERHRDAIDKIVARYPTFLLSGADPLNVSKHSTSDVGVLTIVVPRSTSSQVVKGWINDLADLSLGFESG